MKKYFRLVPYFLQILYGPEFTYDYNYFREKAAIFDIIKDLPTLN